MQDVEESAGRPGPNPPPVVQRWAVHHHASRVTIEPVEAGCRRYECCGGAECGVTLAEAQAEMADHFQRKADDIRAMTPDQFLSSQGYGP